jgi:hypothetical protein
LDSILRPPINQVTMPVMSLDGYIRISLKSLSTLPFVHLSSGSDSDFFLELVAQTIPTGLAGFSECMSDTTPAISLGWAWYVHSDSNRLLLAPEAVRSNVMLIDSYGYDVGTAMTSGLLGAWLTIFNWQEWVLAALPKGAVHERCL